MRTHNRQATPVNVVVFVALLLSLAACASAGISPIATDIPEETVPAPLALTTEETARPAAPSPTTTPASTLRPLPSATATGAPTTVPAPAVASQPSGTSPICGPIDELDARFVHDLGVADGTTLAPGVPFRKAWLIQNTSTCTWPPGTELAFISGDPLVGPQSIPVSATGPGSEVAVSVDLTTPLRPGDYLSYWRLKAPQIGLFGAVVFIDIRVSPNAPPLPAPATPQASKTATSVPPATPSPMPPPPTLRPTPSPVPPTFTPTSEPSPSPFPTVNPDAPCVSPDTRFQEIVNQAMILNLDFQCATGPVRETQGSLQAFWADIEEGDPELRFRSLVVLREDTQKIYALTGRDAHTYVAQVAPYNATPGIDPDERPPACAALVPPAGYNVPTGRIGDTWCRRSLWASIGWPRQPAEAALLEIQETDTGLLIKAEVAGPSSEISLIGIDFEAMSATTSQLSP